MPTLSDFITLPAAAMRLRRTYRQAYDHALRGDLETRREGRALLVSAASVERLAKATTGDGI